METPSLFAVIHKASKAFVTEEDVSNTPSPVPVIKGEDAKWELQEIVDSMGPEYEIVEVVVSVAFS